jgi:hypothetical protein
VCNRKRGNGVGGVARSFAICGVLYYFGSKYALHLRRILGDLGFSHFKVFMIFLVKSRFLVSFVSRRERGKMQIAQLHLLVLRFIPLF